MSDATSNAAPARINRNVLIGGAVVALPLLAVLVANLGRDPHSLRSPLIGRPAPPFSLVPVGGGAPVTLESLRGKTVILNFWATWCIPCFQEHAALIEASRALSDVHFYGVVYEDEEAKTREFIAQRGSGYPSLMDHDGRAAIAYGVFGVPETFFIAGNGRIVDKFVGPLNGSTILALAARAKDGVK
jgi:cytochrome c biogenesis protein CcmG, thiol:disulfide interchange protein DsbE